MVADNKWKWFAEWFERAMKGWGMGTIMMLTLFAVLVSFIHTHGSAYVESKIATDKANAEAILVVSKAVDRLTLVAESWPKFQAQVDCEHQLQAENLKAVQDLMIDASKSMEGAPERGKRQVELLENILGQLKVSNGSGE